MFSEPRYDAPTEPRKDARQLRYRLRREAGRILGADHRTGRCGHRIHGGEVIVCEGTSGTYYAGVETCGSVWTCPVCAGKIAEKRRLQVAKVLDGHLAGGGHQFMVSFTMSHVYSDFCSTLKNIVMAAWRKMLQQKTWQSLKREFEIHWIRSLEVTEGKNGWHPHIHSIFATRALKDHEAARLYRWLRKHWIRAVHGLKEWPNLRNALRRAVDFQRVYKTEVAGNYVAKWGVDSEIARASTKISKKGGRSPWQLLDDSARGDRMAAHRFREYAQAFKGARHMAWSKDFKKKYDADPELTDAEIAASEMPFSGDFEHMRISKALWYSLNRRGLAADLLDCIDAGGEPAALKFLRHHRLILSEEFFCDWNRENTA